MTDAVQNPRLIVVDGRGGAGKTTLARFMVERANDAKPARPMAVADAERLKVGLSQYLEGVMQPEDTTPQGMVDWFTALVDGIAETKQTLVLDLGGGDDAFAGFARSVSLSDLLVRVGITPVLLHVMSADPAELDLVDSAGRAGGYWPAARALVLNEAMGGGRSRTQAFTPVRNHPVAKAFVKGGGKVVYLLRLPVMAHLNEKRLSFSRAENLPPKEFGIVGQQSVMLWRRWMEAEFDPVKEWLP